MGEFLLVPAYPGSPGPAVIKRLCVCLGKQSTVKQQQSPY